MHFLLSILAMLAMAIGLSTLDADTKRTEPINGGVLVAGKSYGAIKLGDSATRVKDVFGKPTLDEKHRLFYEDGHVSFGLKEGKVSVIGCGFWCRPVELNFTGELFGGLKLGADVEEVVGVLGEPDRPSGDPNNGRHVSYRYDSKGLVIGFRGGELASMRIKNPSQ